ncbi:MAG: pyridoxamine 5'-phosphate oxidase family protein [Chloroflexia bacterium]
MIDQKIEHEPDVSRPWMPEGYIVTATEEGMLTWEHVTEVLKDALNYWIATTSSTGRPHVRPVWGAWIDGILYFDGSPDTGWGRNIARDPLISVQVEVGEEAIIIEGVVEDLPQAPDNLADRLAEEFGRKYSTRYKYTPEPDAWRERGLFMMRPHKLLAWNVARFSTSPTRWRFEQVDGSQLSV